MDGINEREKYLLFTLKEKEIKLTKEVFCLKDENIVIKREKNSLKNEIEYLREELQLWKEKMHKMRTEANLAFKICLYFGLGCFLFYVYR